MWKSDLGYYMFEMWLVVIWLADECSFCSQCLKRSPIDLPLAKGFSYGFFTPITPKNPYLLALVYNIATETGNGNANRTGTRKRTLLKFNRFSFRDIIRVSKGTEQKTEPNDTNRFFNPFENRVIITVSTGRVLERVLLLPIDKYSKEYRSLYVL